MLTYWPAPYIVGDNEIPGGAQNSLVSVRVRANLSHSAATLAQELWEREHKRQVVLGCTAAGAVTGALVWLLVGEPLAFLFALAGFIAGAVTVRSAGFRRDMELMGHAVEIAAAVALYQADEEPYRGNEARGMVAWSRYGFEGWSADRVILELRNRRAAAIKWVARHRPYLAKWKEQHG